MSLYYLNFGSFWKNVTLPLTSWHRGTAIQLDVMKDHPEMQTAHMELGTDVVVFTVAARIMQSIVSLVRNILNKRPFYWRMLPGFLSKAFHAVLGMYWSVLDLLLAVEMTRVCFNKIFFNKNKPKIKSLCHTDQTMNTISIKCHWSCPAEPLKETMATEDQGMEKLQETTEMAIYGDCEVLSDMYKMVSKETLLPSCTNPVILSMICIPSEDGESQSPSEVSDTGDQSEIEDDECSERGSFIGDMSDLSEETDEEDYDEGEENGCSEKGSCLEDVSVDSGMQESWTPKSKDNSEDCNVESDWSDAEDDSWDSDSNGDYNKEDDDLWASFCRNDDPYNPLCFGMPTRSPKQQSEDTEKPVPTASVEHLPVYGNPDSAKPCALFRVDSSTGDETQKCTALVPRKKPVLSRFKSFHKSVHQRDGPEHSPYSEEQADGCIRKVRFSPSVTVHRMVTWSYAHRMARRGPWEEYARDHSRFQRRIAETEAAIGYCLDSSHREKVWAGLSAVKTEIIHDC